MSAIYSASAILVCISIPTKLHNYRCGNPVKWNGMSSFDVNHSSGTENAVYVH